MVRVTDFHSGGMMAALQRTSPSLSPQSGSSNGGWKLPTPRGARLSVRDNRKEAIATSLTLDFISLSECDREMVQECDDSHATEARKRSFCTAKEPSASTEPKRHRGSSVLAPPKSPALSSEGPSSELGDFDLRIHMTKPPKRREPIRPQSSRGGDSRCGDSMLDDTSPRPRLGIMPPLLRSLRMCADVHLRPPSSLLGHCPASHAGCSSSQPNSVPSSSPRDLTNHSPRPPNPGGAETPPGGVNAFEAHAKLVQCPAPRRPATFRRPVQNQRRPRSALALVDTDL